MAAYAGVLLGGVTGSGAVIGLRILTLAKPAQVDATVPASAILDRLAPTPWRSFTLPVPPVSVFVSWAGVAPAADRMVGHRRPRQRAWNSRRRSGIAEIAAGTGLAAQVEALRARVWSAPFAEGTPAPRGLAFAAYGLGFVRGRARAAEPRGHLVAAHHADRARARPVSLSAGEPSQPVRSPWGGDATARVEP